MNPETILADKTLKTKAKVETLSSLLLSKKISADDLLNIASTAKDPEKATCIEALEFATKKQPSIATESCLKFLAKSLASEAPRVKWESARVIGNIAGVFPSKLKPSIKQLLINTENPGTVVRWSAAYALAEIVKLKTSLNKELLPAIEAICKWETDNGVKKKYTEAIKKISK